MAAGPPIADRAKKAALTGKSSILLKRLEANDNILTAEDVSAAAAAIPGMIRLDQFLPTLWVQ